MKIKLAVIFGGRSVEHEVSIISAIQAMQSFDRERYEVIPLYLARDERMYAGEALADIEEYRDVKALLKKSTRVIMVSEGGKTQLLQYPPRRFGSSLYSEIDVAFPIVHGTNVEDGALQGYLRTLGVPFAGCDVLASAVGMDKYMQKAVLRDRGIPVLPGLTLDVKRYAREPERSVAEIETAIAYPVIVKPVNLGSSVGIRVARDRAGLLDALDYAFRFAQTVLAERAVEQLRELNCSVLGDYEEALASECEEPVSTADILSYEDKYISGGKSEGSKGMSGLKRILPAKIPTELRERVRRIAVEAFQALGCCGVARIDFLMDGGTGELWVNEINTIPGSLSFYLWEPLGLKYPALLDKIVELALKRRREGGELSYSFETKILQGYKPGGKLKTGGKL